MEWYQVTKTIKGRQYLYWQKTYRVGGSVKTLNKYIGPGVNGPRMPSLKTVMKSLPEPHQQLRKLYDAGKLTKTEYLEALAPKPEPVAQYDATVRQLTAAITTSKPKPSESEKPEPDERPRRENYTRDEWLEIKREERQRAREYAAAMKVENAKIRKSKRETRGIKALNPFLAKAKKKDPPTTTTPPSWLDNGRYFCRRCERQVHAVDWEMLCQQCGEGTHFVRIE